MKKEKVKVYMEVIFKSDTPNYYPEENGDKSNTVRTIQPSDTRKDILDNMLRKKKYGKITIIHKQLQTEYFIRDISNITYYNGCYIISWKHKNVKKKTRNL